MLKTEMFAFTLSSHCVDPVKDESQSIFGNTGGFLVYQSLPKRIFITVMLWRIDSIGGNGNLQASHLSVWVQVAFWNNKVLAKDIDLISNASCLHLLKMHFLDTSSKIRKDLNSRSFKSDMYNIHQEWL